MKTDNDIHYYDYNYRKSKNSILNKIVILFLSLVFSVAVIFILVSPEFKRMKLMKLEKETITGNLKLKRNMINRIVKFNKTNKDLDDNDLKKIYNLLPDDDNFIRQIASINKFAVSGGNGILIKEFSASKAKSSVSNKLQNGKNVPDFKETSLNFSFSGSFMEFMSFFDHIEKNIPLIDVESLNITKEKAKNENESKNMLNCKVMFLLHYL